MSIAATLANNRALDKAMTKAIPLAYTSLSRHLLTNPAYGSRSISTTVYQPRLMPNQSPSTFKQPYSPISPSSAAFRNVSRHFSTDRHLDPYDRFMRRTAVNWGIRFVPQQEAFVVERFGKFHKVLEAGLHVLVPLVDKISYVHSLKEQTIEIPEQPAVTTDNVGIRVNGVLFVKIIDAERASYGNDNVMYAVIQLAQTVMRSAICIFNIAVGKKQSEILTSEAAEIDSINRAAGEAEAMQIIDKSMQGHAGQAAARFKVAQAYVQAFNKMAQESRTVLLPAAVGDPSSMVASALAVYKNQETSTLVVSPTQIEQIEPDVNDEKFGFSLQSPKKN